MNIDTYILLWINSHHTEWLDQIMWWVSQSITWIPLYILMVTWVVWKHRCDWKKILLILLAFAVAVGLSDFITSGIIKPAVQRLRPTHTPGLASLLHIVNGYTGGKYGFCSSHAANTMACALLFAYLYKNKIATAALMLWVAINCYSRIYLGVHFPSDIIVGLIVGALLASAAFALLRFREIRNEHHADAEVAQPGDS